MFDSARLEGLIFLQSSARMLFSTFFFSLLCFQLVLTKGDSTHYATTEKLVLYFMFSLSDMAWK